MFPYLFAVHLFYLDVLSVKIIQFVLVARLSSAMKGLDAGLFSYKFNGPDFKTRGVSLQIKHIDLAFGFCSK